MNQISSIIPLLLLDKIIVNALEEDFGVGGDLTSALTINQFTNSKAEIIARKPGVVACLEVSRRVFNIFDPDLKVDLLVNDGDMIKANTPIKKLRTDQGNDCKTIRTPSIGHSSSHDTPIKNQPK